MTKQSRPRLGLLLALLWVLIFFVPPAYLYMCWSEGVPEATQYLGEVLSEFASIAKEIWTEGDSARV